MIVETALPLAGKTALVTGGRQGIGEAIAHALAESGAQVVITSRNAPKSPLFSEAPGLAGMVALEVASEEACNAAVRLCEERLGSIDILVNSAGIVESRKFLATDTDLWRRHMSVDVEGPFWLIRAALPRMLERRAGAVISIGSLSSRLGLPYVSAYTAAKHALLGLTRALAAEFADSGVTFNCVCPYYVQTPMADAAIENIMTRTGRDRSAATKHLLNPQNRLIQPEEVAALCVLLASDWGRGINGQAINVDGGQLQS